MIEKKLEICCYSPQDCANAENGGASRIELCSGRSDGGLTPSIGCIQIARERVSIPIHVIIRPRGGDFFYSDLEIETMIKDIENARTIGVEGVVFGCLDKEGGVDKKQMAILMEASKGLNVTFHRAFDVAKHPMEALEDIIALGCSRILTSGQEQTADKALFLLKKLVEEAKDKIIIMPGSGVNEKNIREISLETGAREFHSSATIVSESPMLYRNPVSMSSSNSGSDEFSRFSVSEIKVRAMKHELEK